MPTFTNENSALGDMGGHSGQLDLGFLTPMFLGTLVSTGTYLFCRETGAHTICIPVGLLIGFVAMSLCFVAEKERHMLIEDETSCISDSPNKAMRPNFWVWLRLQGFFLASAVPVFMGLVFFGDPVFELYRQAYEIKSGG